MLQCKLTRKALEAFAALSVEDSLLYYEVKIVILQPYELVPEAVLQLVKIFQLNICRVCSGEGNHFDWWCLASKANDLIQTCSIIIVRSMVILLGLV